MPTWPASLPQKPLAQGYGEKFVETGIRFEPDAGVAIQRQRYTAGAKPFQIRLRLTPAQVATFESFWENDLANGALEFDWKHPRTGAAATFRFLVTAAPDVVAINRGLIYETSFALEIMP